MHILENFVLLILFHLHANVYLLLTTLAQGLVMSSQTYTETWSGDIIAKTPSSSKDNLIGNQSVDGTYCSNTHTHNFSNITLRHLILFPHLHTLISTSPNPHIHSSSLLFYTLISNPTTLHINYTLLSFGLNWHLSLYHPSYLPPISQPHWLQPGLLQPLPH